jgi:hypothetical protein
VSRLRCTLDEGHEGLHQNGPGGWNEIHTAESIITGYIFSSVTLGAKFGEEPHRGYSARTAATAIRDLADHGFVIRALDGPSETVPGPTAAAPPGVARCHAPCGVAVCWLPKGHEGGHVCGSVGGPR